MANEIKRCPFRTDENGEFAECYGEECMAYLEYDQPVISYEAYREHREPPKVRVTACQMMKQPMFLGGSCG